jgi:hypothetical protein
MLWYLGAIKIPFQSKIAPPSSRFSGVLSLSKDKTPYKANMGAAVGREGRRTRTLAIYLHVEPGDASFIANGLYEPDKDQLEQVRQHIAQDAKSLRDILAAPEFVRWFGAMDGDQLKTAPQGYDRDHPAIDLLRYKQFLAMHHLSGADFGIGHVCGHLFRGNGHGKHAQQGEQSSQYDLHAMYDGADCRRRQVPLCRHHDGIFTAFWLAGRSAQAESHREALGNFCISMMSAAS